MVFLSSPSLTLTSVLTYSEISLILNPESISRDKINRKVFSLLKTALVIKVQILHSILYLQQLDCEFQIRKCRTIPRIKAGVCGRAITV